VKEGEAGRKVADLCRVHGIAEQTCYRWKATYGGMELARSSRLSCGKPILEKPLPCCDLCGARYYGPEFAGRTLDAWAYAQGISLRFIRPRKPIENAYVESFNGKFGDECLNEQWFVNLVDAKDAIERWRVDYNTVRPHSSLTWPRRNTLPGSLKGLAGCRRLALTRKTETKNPRSSHYPCSRFWGRSNGSASWTNKARHHCVI
jgi:putative transposase